MKTLLLLSLLALAPAARAAFGSADAGTTAAGFLKLGAGARAAGLGEAYTAAADDASALYWNPAGLARVERGSAVLMHAPHIERTFFDYASFAHRAGAGVMALGAQYFSAGRLAATDALGRDVGAFRPNDLAVSLGYACSAGGWSLGAAGKYIRSEIAGTASTGAADVGVQSPKLGGRLRLGAAASNIGGNLRFDAAREKLPLTFRAGAALDLTERWLAAVDGAAPRDNDPYGAVGTEYSLAVGKRAAVAGRAGFQSRGLEDLDGLNGAAFGVGLRLAALEVDYAVVPMGRLGQGHRVSLTFSF